MKKFSALNQPESGRIGGGKNTRETIGFLSEVKQSDGRRPKSLTKTAEGASKRLTALTDMLRSYSIIDELPQKPDENRSSVDFALGEINRLQYLLGTELPNISKLTLPTRTSDLLLPRRTLEDIEAFLDAPFRSSDEELKVEWQPSARERVHDFLRDMALKKLESDTFKKLSIIYNTHIAVMKPHDDGNAPAVSPFAWTLADFLKRRQERNNSWVDSLSQRTEKDLEMLKFKCDMEELFKLLKPICKGLLSSVSPIARQELFIFVHDANHFLKFPQEFRLDAKTNMEKLREQVNTYLDMWFYKRGKDEEIYKQRLEQQITNIAVIGPIELRYQVGWMRAKTDQAVMKMTNVIEDLEKQAERLRQEESKESYCASCSLNMYHLDIENFKRRIATTSAKFEAEFDKAENEIAYKKISMDKLRAQRKYLEEQMVRFKEELEELRQREIEEKEAEEQRKQREAQLLLEEQLALKKKAAELKKKKKKGKK